MLISIDGAPLPLGASASAWWHRESGLLMADFGATLCTSSGHKYGSREAKHTLSAVTALYASEDFLKCLSRFAGLLNKNVLFNINRLLSPIALKFAWSFWGSCSQEYINLVAIVRYHDRTIPESLIRRLLAMVTLSPTTLDDVNWGPDLWMSGDNNDFSGFDPYDPATNHTGRTIHD